MEKIKKMTKRKNAGGALIMGAVFFSLVFSGAGAVECVEFAGGEGTLEAPYRVETIEQLQEIRRHPSAHFVLATDIDASDTANWNMKNDYEKILAGKADDGTDFRLPHSPLENGSVVVYVAGVEREDGFIVDYSAGVLTFDSMPHEYYALEDEQKSAEITVDYKTGYDHYRGFIPVRNFSGTLDGAGNRIRALYINRPEDMYVALFGNTSAGSVIKDVGLEDVNITGAGRVAGLIGNSYSIISRCYTTGTVSGNYRVGGLAGVNFAHTITDSYSRADVKGPGRMKGGLVGLQYKSILRNSYSTGSVSGDLLTGGLIGVSSTGDGFEISNSFWDIESSGIDRTTRHVVGMPTAGMKSIETFREAGWDIAPIDRHRGETWKIDDGKDYPRLGGEQASREAALIRPVEESSAIRHRGRGVFNTASPSFIWFRTEGNF